MKRKLLLQRIASRIAGLFGIRFYNLYYVEKKLLTNTESVEPSVELKIRNANAKDLSYIIKLLGNSIRKEFEYAMAIGSTCYVALHDGKVAGYSWVNCRIIYLNGMHVVTLPDNGSYNTNSYVFPECRGQKVFQSLISRIYSDMKKEGCTFTANLVDKSNAPSIAARKRFSVNFQNAQILKLPGLKPIIVGKPFVMGASLSSVSIIQNS